MTPQQFAHAIAVIESGDVSNPQLGDEGRALGRYQAHPDFVWEWATRLPCTPMLNETWDSFFTRLVQMYFTFRTGQGLTPVQAAVSYHVGHVVREADPTWDASYAQRFTEAAT